MKTEFTCENCGNKVMGIEYHDEYSMVEQHYECSKCGYRRHWAYGNILPNDSDYKEEEIQYSNEYIKDWD